MNKAVKKKLLIGGLAWLVGLFIIIGIMVLTNSPAGFVVANLIVSPAVVKPGDTVTITISQHH
ncbi:MAG: hypothetical protein E3J60_02035 [Dehalococcoidia bacterium]|nr:MAG: hypothetical protein E3J60_02035 [Dehalococcoidia bacterium]